MTASTARYKVRLKRPHPKQEQFIRSEAKRKVIRAGRRSGKTTGIAIYAVQKFLEGRRVLYAAPTEDQVSRFWFEVCQALDEPLGAGLYYKNETKHIIERPKTNNRIRAKTAWNADTLRGDYADVLILDEFQLMNEETWGVVGAPMLIDNNGDAVFIYTPPSLNSRSASKANDPQHAAKMYRKAKTDTSGRWETFHFNSYDNPHVSSEAVSELAKDMTNLAYRMEIMAEDVDQAPGALWLRTDIEKNRRDVHPDLVRLVIAIDPSVSSSDTSDEAGIVSAGIDAFGHGYVLGDHSLRGSPLQWARAAIKQFEEQQADRIVAEKNNGGEMVELTIQSAVERGEYLPVTLVTASRGKATRAEPISALYEKGLVHHVGAFETLEDQMCLWEPGQSSPDRMDALVWALTDLMLEPYDPDGGVH